MEQIDEVRAGDIFAIFGVDCSTGDNLNQADTTAIIKCQSMFVPEPVMSLNIKPSKRDNIEKL